ncbi:chromosome segregation and condensation protein, ScpB [Micromonospora sp. L5]|uniref:SMC-Scp complex subunit ScpB n=1 Tax=Micromonospora sp. (strain L5) TaxID=648999 RepID=UPI0001C448FD|nr:SMC-Scp complex subunit ScpB [Micromonospora sp. L5]ADU11488.1 chromosome segregation and condensation protein, ScpB [Micromonospora sp. L5]
MSDEERRDSLADQAAAWVPPWERPAPPKPAPDDSDPPAEHPAPEIADTAGYREADLDATPDSSADLGSEGPPEGPIPSKIATVQGDLGAGTPLGGRDRTKISGEAGTDDVGRDVAEAAQEAAPRAGGGAGADGVPPKRGRRRAVPEPAPAPVLDDAELRGALEAILLVVDQPVSELVLAEILEQAPERVGAMLDEIAAGYTAAGHGFDLRRAAGGWRLYTRPEYATYVERFVLDGQSVRLTQAALETLAVVAYRQPVTRSRISAIRGVNCDGVLRTLVGRGLVEECGTEADSGAYLYRTTTMFLEKLGLNSVDDLPPLAPFLPDDVEELADATR